MLWCKLAQALFPPGMLSILLIYFFDIFLQYICIYILIYTYAGESARERKKPFMLFLLTRESGREKQTEREIEIERECVCGREGESQKERVCENEIRREIQRERDRQRSSD